MRTFFVCAVFAELLAGCATPYQPVGAMGGFDEVRLASDLYRVSVQGNGYTSDERAYQIMLLRAAELTLANGYSKFALLEEDKRVQQDLVYNANYGYNTVNRPNGSLVVKMLPAEDETPSAFDAASSRRPDGAQRNPGRPVGWVRRGAPSPTMRPPAASAGGLYRGRKRLTHFVTPAKAGVQLQPRNKLLIRNWIPAFAGMTTEFVDRSGSTAAGMTRLRRQPTRRGRSQPMGRRDRSTRDGCRRAAQPTRISLRSIRAT